MCTVGGDEVAGSYGVALDHGVDAVGVLALDVRGVSEADVGAEFVGSVADERFDPLLVA
ncbi:hypothetical protein Ae706Ps2_6729 [Pseudonocardia sp. Ae706_Ps2]|nr:hypothetical protein Ae706Ps2_6729 [Pseudonocardia sp. Ae706_Ps2]